MANETKTMMDKIVEAADLVYGTAADRTVEHMKQTEENIEKDINVAKKASSVVIETAEVVAEAAADHFAGLLNGEKIDLSKEKQRAIETIDKVVEKADEYYGMVVDRVVEKMEQREQNMEKDIETGKQLASELKSNS